MEKPFQTQGVLCASFPCPWSGLADRCNELSLMLCSDQCFLTAFLRADGCCCDSQAGSAMRTLGRFQSLSWGKHLFLNTAPSRYGQGLYPEFKSAAQSSCTSQTALATLISSGSAWISTFWWLCLKSMLWNHDRTSWLRVLWVSSSESSASSLWFFIIFIFSAQTMYINIPG